jgi:CBS domain-containing protein
VIPIVDLARWVGMSAGVTIASTPERLRAAQGAGFLPDGDLLTLDDAFALISELRVGHRSPSCAPGPRLTTILIPMS